jgi:guanylate kinase
LHTTDPTLIPERQPLLIVVSGPAGAGKDALIQRIRERGYPFHFVVTATDRPPRRGEREGIDYHFVSSAAFSRMVENDELLEHAVVYGQNKGIPKQQVRQALESGLDVVMRIDVQGARTMQQIVPDAVFIFLTAASISELEGRLRGRGGDSEQQVQARLAKARDEMERIHSFGYAVVNRDGQLDQAVDDVLAIVRAEHLRVGRRRIEL